MVQKPKIQYVGQFYVHGSEARALELEQQQKQKKAKTRLPLAQLEKIEKVYIDPVALAGIAVAVIMLITMVVGAVQIRDDWKEYETVANYVSYLHRENARLTHEYRSSYDLDEIEMKALALGMVPKSELEVITVTVTVPQPEPEVTLEDKILRFWYGLWE